MDKSPINTADIKGRLNAGASLSTFILVAKEGTVRHSRGLINSQIVLFSMPFVREAVEIKAGPEAMLMKHG
jgi:hypothetical protein